MKKRVPETRTNLEQPLGKLAPNKQADQPDTSKGRGVKQDRKNRKRPPLFSQGFYRRGPQQFDYQSGNPDGVQKREWDGGTTRG